MKRIFLLGGALAGSLGIALFSCVSDQETPLIDGGPLADEAGSMNDMTTDGASATDGGGNPGSDGGPSSSCTSSCTNPTMLKDCYPDGAVANVACAYDCVSDGGPHCTVFVPTPPVTAADVDFSGLADVVIAADGFVQTDTGSIDNVRAASADAGATDTMQGVRYHVANGVGIFSMKSLTVQTGVTLKLRGTRPVAIVADTITVKGILDLRGYDGTGNLCVTNVAGPGGFVGGTQVGEAGAGPGGGQPTNASGNGGGGGNGGQGGLGGTNGPEGGAPYPFTSPIVGGSGGGTGTKNLNLAYGGGGGGALQLVGATSISIGDVTAPAGVNAGGCGGKAQDFGAAAAGGGSGGTIFIESPAITLHDQCVIAANGGAGSGVGDSSGTNGGNAGFNANPAVGGATLAGNGGAGGTVNGGNGSNGGGGGATGRIRLLDYAGSINAGANVIISPGQATTATTVGKVGMK